MNLIRIRCAFCKKEFFRTKGRVNEAKKFGWRQYCSLRCQMQTRLRRVEKSCANPNCKNRVSRELNQFRKSKSGRLFCSASCTAIFNNPLRRKFKICPICKKQFSGSKIYCSSECHISTLRKTKSTKKKEILKEIKDFYRKQKRIPLKRERPGLAWRAHYVFGGWNNAIKSAGFEPNPIVFSQKFIADDGHKCDSFAEKIIDDWLFSKKMGHKRNAPYPRTSYTADFQINNNFVEFFGLSGELAEYDRNIKIKEGLVKRLKLNLIKIYPKDLFPINHLSEIIKI